MDLAEPPGRAAGGTAPMIVTGLDGSPASGRRLRDPCAVETERDPARGPSVCGAAASQPARYAASDAWTPSAERERSTMEAGPPIRAEPDDLGGFRRTDGQRPTRSDSAGRVWIVPPALLPRL